MTKDVLCKLESDGVQSKVNRSLTIEIERSRSGYTKTSIIKKITMPDPLATSKGGRVILRPSIAVPDQYTAGSHGLALRVETPRRTGRSK